jgi:hypothetical protein
MSSCDSLTFTGTKSHDHQATKGGLQGGLTAAAFFQTGEFLGGRSGGVSEGIALHGVAGCVTSELGGGKCGPGALSAAFSKALAPATAHWTKADPLAGVAVSAVVGGTASVLGGGKFANGAQTAAFGYLYNALVHMMEGIAADRLISEFLKVQFPGLDIELQQRTYWPWKTGYGTIDMVVTSDDTAYIFEIKKYTYASSHNMSNYLSARKQLSDYVLSEPNAAVGDWSRFFSALGNNAYMSGSVQFSSGRTLSGGIVFGPDSYTDRSGLIFYNFISGAPLGASPIMIDYSKKKRP